MRSGVFRRIIALAMLALVALPVTAFGADPTNAELAEQAQGIATAVNQIWVVLAAILVLFMQAGFAMLEIGLSRMKNAGAVAGKIIINLAISFLMFWAVGFSLAFATGNGFAGSGGWFMDLSNFTEQFASLSYSDTPLQAQFFFQVVFVAVSLAIVFGAMLDRTKFAAYLIFGVVFTGLIYPIVAHWTWGGGWLAQDGFLDFAGSSIVHLQGALAALAGTLLLTGAGVPFIYYGEELGMRGRKPDEDIRTPLAWDSTEPGRGFTTGEPWEPFAPGVESANVAGQTGDPASLLSHYRSLIALRAAHPALRSGSVTQMTELTRGIHAYLRADGDEIIAVSRIAHCR